MVDEKPRRTRKPPTVDEETAQAEPDESPSQNTSRPGGYYIVNGKPVNANGEPIDA